jgi:NhaP-type Na+/H+ and K+/H+ antiporter
VDGGAGLALLLIVTWSRPVVVGLVLLPDPTPPRASARSCCSSGLKGAVPILLGTYVLLEGADRAARDLRHRLRGAS